MLRLAWAIRQRIRTDRQVLVRGKPAEGNPFTGITGAGA